MMETRTFYKKKKLVFQNIIKEKKYEKIQKLTDKIRIEH